MKRQQAFSIIALSLSLAVPYAGTARAEELPTQSGDRLNVVVQGEADLTRAYVVDADGNITVNLVGKVPVKGLAPAQVRDELTKRLAKYVRDPQVSVDWAERAQISVNVTGAVKKAGAGNLKKGARVLDAIALAEGVLPEADTQKVRLQRRGEPAARMLDLKKLLLGDASINLELQDGDALTVPAVPVSVVRVFGAVKKPGDVKGEEQLTLSQAVEGVGDVTTDADKKKVQILRKNATQPEVIDFDEVRAGKIPNPILKDGDTVTIPEYPKVQINVQGYVAKGGAGELRSGSTVLDAITAAGGFAPDADKMQVAVTEPGGGKRILNLDKVTNPDCLYHLSQGAQVYVPQLPIRRFAVGGGVVEPGTFPFPADPGQKVYLTDALAAAKGPVVRAKKKTIAIVRKDASGKPQAMVVDLETYLTHKGKGGKDGAIVDNPEIQVNDVVVVDVEPDPREKKPSILERVLGIASNFAF